MIDINNTINRKVYLSIKSAFKLSLLKNIPLIGVLLLAACSTTKEVEQVSSDGLNLIKSTESTIAYKKEGVDFSVFDTIIVLPSTVAFQKDWKRNYNQNQSMSMRVTDDDMVEMRTSVAHLFDKTFSAELAKSDAYTLINKPQVGSLFIKPAIINLEVNSPDLGRTPTNKKANRSTGNATLYLEFFDGVSGEILARVIDADTIGADGRMFRIANNVTNRKDTKLLIEKWATALRVKLDELHSNKESAK